MLQIARRTPWLVALYVIAGCFQPSAEKATGPDDPHALSADGWTAFVSRFVEEYLEAHPAFAVVAGRHEFDGRLPDWSREGIAREVARLHEQKRTALAFSDDRLSQRQRFDRDYVISRIDHDLFWLEVAEWPFRCPAFYFSWMMDSLDPNVYVAREYAPLDQRLRAYTKYARAVPRAAAQIRANLRTPLPRTYIEYAIAGFDGLASYFESDVPEAFSGVTDETLVGEFRDANRGAIRAMRDLASWLKEQRATATDSFAIGSELFARMVRDTEGVEISLERLEEVGEADLARNTRALEQACAEFAPGSTIEDCVQKAAARKTEGGPVKGARSQLAGLKEFLLEKELVAIPGTEEALVEEAPPYMRWNFAYIDIPGPYEKGLPSVYYIAPPDPSWPAEEQLAYLPGEADLLFVSVHEVWPGHFLNFLHANRSEFLFGRLFVTYAFGEGWAHYAEEMMWEAGLNAGDAETHIGQLLNALLRNVRFLSAIRLHTKGMTVAESERWFREKALQDPGNARQQAARGTYDPAYLNYTLGKLIIRKLRADWTATRDGRESWRAFHDTILSFGGPPLPLVRRAMLGEGAGPAL